MLTSVARACPAFPIAATVLASAQVKTQTQQTCTIRLNAEASSHQSDTRMVHARFTALAGCLRLVMRLCHVVSNPVLSCQCAARSQALQRLGAQLSLLCSLCLLGRRCWPLPFWRLRVLWLSVISLTLPGHSRTSQKLVACSRTCQELELLPVCPLAVNVCTASKAEQQTASYVAAKPFALFAFVAPLVVLARLAGIRGARGFWRACCLCCCSLSLPCSHAQVTAGPHAPQHAAASGLKASNEAGGKGAGKPACVSGPGDGRLCAGRRKHLKLDSMQGSPLLAPARLQQPSRPCQRLMTC